MGNEPDRRRRSERMALNLPVHLAREQGPPVPSIATVVNRHGALVSSPISCTENEILSITNLDTDEVALCRVVYVGEPSAGFKQRLGIEFLRELPGFWGAAYEAMVALSAVEETGERLREGSEARSPESPK